jgi:RHS repeat-associated protein
MVKVAEPDPGGDGTLSSGALFTTYTYDALDRLVQVNQGAQTRSFRYDSVGRLTHQKLAERDAKLNDSGAWVEAGQWSDVFTYDNRSNMTQHVDARGVKTIFKYIDGEGNEDPLNRLLAVEYDKSGSPANLSVNIPVAPNVSYAYVTAGDKRRVQNVTVDQGMGNETMSYDSEGRLSQVVQTFTGRESYPLETDYIWDSLDRLKENTYPQQYIAGEIRKKVEPAYDAASRIDSLKFGGTTYASEPVYNAASQTTSLKVGAQMTESYEYDPKTGLLTNQKVKRGTTETLLDLKYNYTLDNDANNNGPKTGQLTGVTDLKNQARNRAYEYDKLGRLIKVKGGVNAFTTPNWYQTYSYDRYGNRSLVHLTALGMAPVKPGSQSRSDLIGKVGPGAGGAANRVFSVDDPFAALGINEGYGSITTGLLDSDSAGTPVRGGPRATAEESGNAPSANGVGGELLAEHPAGAAPSAPQKKYSARRGLSIVTAQSVSSVNPTAYQTPDPVQGGWAVSSPSNTGHGNDAISLSHVAPGSDARSCLWRSFQSVGGQVQSITLKFDWVATGSASVQGYNEEDSVMADIEYSVEYSLNGGGSWVGAAGYSLFAEVNGVGSDGVGFSNPNHPATTPVSISIPANTPINQIMVRDRLGTSIRTSGGATGYSSVGAYGPTRVENIRLEVVTDTTAPVISNVVAGGITSARATITWTTNENSDSQVEYWVDPTYRQSAPATPNPALVTTHSQALSGLTAGTVYHYRVRSRDAAGNLAVSGDFTFTTTQNGSIPLDGLASLSYNTANNRINTSGFEYDPAGNQTRAVIGASGTQQQYRYDCAGRLAQVLDGAGNELARYSYGAGNQRLMSVEGGVTKYFAWAGRKIISEYEAWGANALIWKKSYVYLGGRLLATTSGADGTETQFHHPDELGTRLVTGAGGTVVTEQLSMPFGTMLPFTQTYGGENSYQHPTLSNPSKKRFTSYDRSDVTGLHYAVNRSYSSEQGRFTQVDPIEMDAASLSNPQTLNLYAYCGNDPINHVDPAGTSFFGKLFGWIGKILKWVAVAAVIAVAVIAHVMPATRIVSLAQWAAHHSILAGILGINTPNFAILHLAAIGTESAVIGVGAGAYLSSAVRAVTGFLVKEGQKGGRKFGKPIGDAGREAIVKFAVLGANKGLKNRKCREYLGVKDPDLLNKLFERHQILEGNLMKLVGRTAGAITDGIGEDAFITLDEYFFFSDKEMQVMVGEIIGTDICTARAIIMLHELSHATGKFYHLEQGNTPQFKTSKPAPYNNKYGQASLDRKILENCFGGKGT